VEVPASNVLSPGLKRPWLLSLALVLSGLAGLGIEMVWFRHLSIQLGAYRAVFSVLLTVVLIGIWAGAVAGGALHRRFGRAIDLLMLGFSGFALTTVLSLAYLRPWLRNGAGVEAALELRTIVATVALPAFFMGFAYPLANASIQTSVGSVGRRAGLLYLANTLGAVIGSLLVGFVLIQGLGTQTTVTVLLLVSLGSILAAYGLQPQRWRSMLISVVVFCVALGAWARLPADFLLKDGIPQRVADHRLISLQEGRHELIAVTESPTGYRRLNTNGHAMSDTALMNQRYMRAFAHLPLLQVVDAKRALVICFGVGSTAHAASLHPLETLEIVDISPDVLEHSKYFASNHKNVLQDPRVRIYVNDGRLHLRMQPLAQYDLITMEPPPIAHAGVSALYSFEFYELVRSRLRTGGFVAQWLPGYQVTAETNLSMVRAFIDAFPDGVLLSGKGNELILLGRKGIPTQFDPQTVADVLAQRPAVRADLKLIHMDTLTELAGTFVADAATLRAATIHAPALTDDFPISEYDEGEHEIPSSLVNVASMSAWCPRCFAEGASLTPRIDEFMRIADAYYASPKFRFQRPKTLDIAMPERISRQVIEQNSYLRSYFRFDPATLVDAPDLP
ncbi:MAG: hypothetical protein AAFN74_07720, partial [Myxococcota bacterium]